jgi:hypothetical protein
MYCTVVALRKEIVAMTMTNYGTMNGEIFVNGEFSVICRFTI